MSIPFNVLTKNLELTEALEEYIERRFSKIDRLVPDDESDTFAAIEVGKVVGDQRKGQIYRAEMNLEVQGKLYRAASEEENLHTAIDNVREDILRELKRDKGKRTQSLRDGGRAIKNMLHQPRPKQV